MHQFKKSDLVNFVFAKMFVGYFYSLCFLFKTGFEIRIIEV